MAKKCCICDVKLSVFDFHPSLIEGNDTFLLCHSCEEKLNIARKTDIDPSNISLMTYYKRATDYFMESLATGELDSAVVAELETLPEIAKKRRQEEKVKAQAEKHERRYREMKDSVMVTTGYSFDGYTITDYHGVISIDTIASALDIYEIAPGTFIDDLKRAKSLAYRDLVKEAIFSGGNAVIGVSYNVYVAGLILGVSATGTSVTIRSSNLI